MNLLRNLVAKTQGNALRGFLGFVYEVETEIGMEEAEPKRSATDRMAWVT
jgi:hypothetical protein